MNSHAQQGGIAPSPDSSAKRIALDAGSSATPVCRTAGYSHQEILRSQTMAASIVGLWGLMFFGPAGAMVLAVSIISAVLAELLISVSTRKPVVDGLWHAALTGLLLGLTLPPMLGWYIPAIGAMVAILSKSLFGGLGHYVWHPALVGRVVLQVLFHNAFAAGALSAGDPVLARDHVLYGWLPNSQVIQLSSYPGWFETTTGSQAHAIVYQPPVRALRRFADGDIEAEGRLILEPLLRDHLPPWPDTILGAVPGCIGETAGLALIVAGLYLIYRGYLRWQLPVSVLVAAALAAAILPVESSAPGEGYHWLPVLAAENGRAVGLAYVLYHLTSGELMLGAFLLAGDVIASPKRVRSQIVFGAAIGSLTIFMRLYGVVEGECYWSILAANHCVPIIDRWIKRPVLGINTDA